jgi:hypothetical protein
MQGEATNAAATAKEITMIAAAMLIAVVTADPSPPRVQAVSIGATWCSPCKFQRNDCERLKESGLRIGEDENCHIRFLYDDKKPTPYKVEAYPTTILFRDGIEVQRWKGQTTALSIAGAMLREQEKLLKGAK